MNIKAICIAIIIGMTVAGLFVRANAPQAAAIGQETSSTLVVEESEYEHSGFSRREIEMGVDDFFGHP